jgi:hypothetical protein
MWTVFLDLQISVHAITVCERNKKTEFRWTRALLCVEKYFQKVQGLLSSRLVLCKLRVNKGRGKLATNFWLMQASYILIKYFCIGCSTQETHWNTGLLSFLTFLHINIMQWYHFRFENDSILNFSKFYCIVLTSWKPEEKRPAARSKCRCWWEDNIKLHLKGTVWSCGLNSSSSRQSPVMVYYEHYAIKGAKCFD